MDHTLDSGDDLSSRDVVDQKHPDQIRLNYLQSINNLHNYLGMYPENSNLSFLTGVFEHILQQLGLQRNLCIFQNKSIYKYFKNAE